MPNSTILTRRALLLRTAGTLSGAALLGRFAPALSAEGAPFGFGGSQAAATVEALTARRQQLAAIPIASAPLGDRLVLLSGPGGNVIVLHGPDGKVLADGFVLPAWSNLKTALDGIGKEKIALLIDTHWHFDHADNNGNLHAAGAQVLAHVKTKERLAQTHDILGMHFEPVPAGALPTETFTESHKVHVNGEDMALGHFAAAHTDTDIFIHYTKANVLHMGDVFFNGIYPFIDSATGGNIAGMIAGADRALTLVDSQTKIVPGHGKLADKTALTAYRDMLVTARDRVQKLKTSGKTLAEVQAAKPIADLDAVWAGGMLKGDDFVALVYNTL
jgi:glyoxylase-like metal-dependent hydrolase (beta-lactamase superfamily II)